MMDDDNEMVLVHSSDIVWVPESELKHYGVPGMRWGKRSTGTSDSSGSTKPASKSKQRTQMIKDARNNLDDSYKKTILAVDKYNSAKTDKSRKIAEKALEKAGDEYMTNVARSMQKTRGEKIANGIAIGVSAAAVLAPTISSLARR